MADSYGVLIFSKSDDCDFDGEELVRRMNMFRWSIDNIKWDWDDQSESPITESFYAEYPCAIPERISRILIETASGSEEWVDFGDLEWEIEDALDIEVEEVEFDQVCAYLVPAIRAGWIEIASVSNEKLRFGQYTSMQVYANGHGVCQSYCTGQAYPSGSFIATTEGFSKIVDGASSGVPEPPA
jgi:hypothetical protein